MKEIRFRIQLLFLTLGKLCQQPVLLAGLALLCFLLPLGLSAAAESVLSRGVDFGGVKLAITAPKDDAVPQQLEQVLGRMGDIRRYCEVTAMTRQEALDALERQEVTAILALPEDFVRGVMNGRNPDVELIVRGDRPLEALLTLWLGQSASDMLAAFQSGIYAVLDAYDQASVEGLTRQQVVANINLRYISWMMNRQELFRTEMVSATGQLSVAQHYKLSILAYLGLALAPVFMPVYDPGWIRSQNRFRAAGRGSITFFAAAFTACALVEFVIFALAGGGNFPAAAICALFCAAFGSLCCLVCADTSGCAQLSFGGSLVFLALSGGILPPVLLPDVLRQRLSWWPVTWLREVMSGTGDLVVLMAASILMIISGWLLYRRRGREAL